MVEVLHQIKLIQKKIQALEDLVYSHNHRHVYEGQDTLFALDASQVETGVFDLARIPSPLQSKLISEVFTAGADITAGQLVAITGDLAVSPADISLRSQVVGVALNGASIGEDVEVVIYGKTTVIADGVISAGDPVAAASTPGRVVSLVNHSHTNPSVNSAGAHTHSVPDTSSVDLAHAHTNPNTGSAGAHTHSFTPAGTIGATSINHRHSFTPAGSISSVSAGTPSGSISSDSAGTPSGGISVAPSHTHTNPNVDSTTPHSATRHGIIIVGYSACEVAGAPAGALAMTSGYEDNYAVGTGGHTHTQGVTGSGGAHDHTFVGDALPTHNHTFTGSALPTHSHTFTGSAGNTGYTNPSHSHTFTGSAGTTGSAGAHAHTQGSTGSALGTHHHTVGNTGSSGAHTHTQGNTGTVGNAQIAGKALISGNVGDEIQILVCLAG